MSSLLVVVHHMLETCGKRTCLLQNSKSEYKGSCQGALCGYIYTGLFISPSGISELDCATTKTDTAERSVSICRESLQVFFVLGALPYFQVPPLGGSHDEKWRSQ